MEQQPATDFEKAVTSEASAGILGDFWHFLKDNKKWWLLPILLVLLAFGVLMVLSGTAAAPFIYTLF